jgi:hypothetical protein
LEARGTPWLADRAVAVQASWIDSHLPEFNNDKFGEIKGFTGDSTVLELVAYIQL